MLHFSVCACHPCAGAMLIFSVSFQFYWMISEGNPLGSEQKRCLPCSSGITSATDGPSLLISPCLLSFVLASVPMSLIPQQCLLAAACHTCTCPRRQSTLGSGIPLTRLSWTEARVKIARMTLTIKLDGSWSSFQLANSAPPLSVTDSAIAPSARMFFQQLLT